MKRALDGMGFNTGESESPVIPVVVGDDMAAWQSAQAATVSDYYHDGRFAALMVLFDQTCDIRIHACS